MFHMLAQLLEDLQVSNYYMSLDDRISVVHQNLRLYIVCHILSYFIYDDHINQVFVIFHSECTLIPV